jgi:hypothetical protein
MIWPVGGSYSLILVPNYGWSGFPHIHKVLTSSEGEYTRKKSALVSVGLDYETFYKESQHLTQILPNY